MRLIDADALTEFFKARMALWLNVDEVLDEISDAPELPKEQDVVRCKDCRWWNKDRDSEYGYCFAMKHGYMSRNWEISIYRRYKGDFYCADAEKR